MENEKKECMEYGVTHPVEFESYCLEHNWFNKTREDGRTEEAYEKALRMNREGYSIAGIASVIFLYTTNWSWGKIYDELKRINREYKEKIAEETGV